MRPRSVPFPAALAALAALSIVSAAPPCFASPELRVDGRSFKDAAGRVVILRGVNVAGNAKVPPFTAASDPAIFDPLARWGMNAIRLLFTWEAYEPAPGQYDQAYLDYYAGAAKAAWDRGLYVIVDFHQDAFSRYSIGGCGEGFPKWALPPEVKPATPDNGPACADWGMRLLGDADMKASWSAFHADTHGVKTRYLAALKSIAARLDGLPGVVGYDMINEPWGDETTELPTTYAAAAAAIRGASPTAILFVSPHALISAGGQTKLPKPAFENFVYSPHFYDATIFLSKSWAGHLPTDAYATMGGKAVEWGVPLVLGEFGAPAGTANGDLYLDALYDWLNEGFASGTQWVYTPAWTEAKKDGWNTEDFSIVDDKGAQRDNFRVRPFARKIAGTPKLLKVTRADPAGDGVIEVSWDNDPTTGATEIFVPAQAFFETAAVGITADGTGLACAAAGDLVTCASKSTGLMHVVLRHGAAAAKAPTAKGSCGLVAVGQDRPAPAAAAVLLLGALAWAMRIVRGSKPLSF